MLVINWDKSVPILGNWLETPPINPPTIPPMNEPIAFPIPFINSAPSFTNQVNPGICANAPIAAKTSANSAITTPIPRTPIIAAGVRSATAARAIIIADNRPIPAIPFTRTSTLIPFRASTTPEKNAIMTSTTDFIRPGKFLATPSRTLIKNWSIASTILGVYFTRASSTSTKRIRAPSAIAGTHSTRTSIKFNTTALIAFPIAGAPFEITLQNSIVASPIFAATVGIRLAIPVIIIVNEATIAVAPAAPAVAKAVKPIANADNPAPAANNPAPIPRTPRPIKVNAPANPRIAGTRGVNTKPATPRTANAPAIDTRPFAMDSQLIAPKILRTGVNTAKAAAATSIAADPAKVPFITLRPIANIAIDPPKTVNPLAISSQLILPILSRADAMITSAVDTTIKPTPISTIFLGMKLTAKVTAANAPAIPTKAFPRSSHVIEAKSLAAEANIFIAAEIAIKAIPVEITFFALPVSFVNIVISNSNAPILDNPFARSSHFISPKSLHAEAKILIADAKITIPMAVIIVFPLNFAVFKNKETSAIRTPTPTKPLARSFQLRVDKSLQAEANILIATANTTRLVAPLTICPLLFDITFANATTMAVIPAIPTRPLAIPSQSSSATFFIAPASIETAIDMAIIAVQVFAVFLEEPLILSNIAIDTIKSANKAVIAANDAANLSESIKEITTIEAVRIAIALAILRSVPALSLV